MVDKNLNHLISTDHFMWLDKFKREIKSHAYCNRSVIDPIYPSLRLWKAHLTSLPVYNGPLRGDSDDSTLGFAFDTCFSSYVRRVYALKHGTKCGMCGCRHRHDLYWSLRMRVCRLCMEANTISGEMLSRKYGVDFSDMLARHKGEFFFFPSGVTNDDRISVHGMNKTDIHTRNTTYIFWLPHLRKFLDFQALYQQQNARREAAVLLSNAVKRRWGTLQRNIYGTAKAHFSVDCLLLTLYRNEKKRVTNTICNSALPGGPNWSFYLARGAPKFQARNHASISYFHRLIVDYEDFVV
jgi:hypothetical protein